MDKIIYAVIELAAILFGMLVSIIIAQPTLAVAFLFALIIGVIYKRGWNDAVDADYADDLKKAASRRGARLR